jgi:hypothetical protein
MTDMRAAVSRIPSPDSGHAPCPGRRISNARFATNPVLCAASTTKRVGPERHVMFRSNKLWAIAAMIGVSAIAAARSEVRGLPGGDIPGLNRKADPAVGDAGQPWCFGDGSGVPCPARNNGAPGHGCENSWGQGGALLAAQGLATISDDSVVLTVSGLPLDTTVIFMQGGKPAFRPYAFGDGLMCLGGAVDRLAVQQPTVWWTSYPGPGDPSLSRAGRLPRLGATVYYQVLYRDGGPISTHHEVNLSNGWKTVWVP